MKLRNVQLQTLSMAVDIADGHRFLAVAEKHCVTQPSVTTSIKRLEQRLGFDIFIRSSARGFNEITGSTDRGSDAVNDFRRILEIAGNIGGGK